MRFKNNDQKRWDEWFAQQKDDYSKEIFRYAERWANLMESAIGSGAVLANIAEKTSREADTSGITGFMYGAAASVLSQTWEHGEELRLWHNLKTQMGNEGEKANEKGTVLNPALLSIGEAEDA